METAFRADLAAWLRADPVLAETVNAVLEEGPAPASPPTLAIIASAGADWSTKTATGREVRVALELVDRSDEPLRTGRIAEAVERRIAVMAPQQSGYRICVTRFLRSRHERRPRALRAVLVEYRFCLLADPS